MKAVIPTAGLGTHFLPYTKTQPKEMLPVIGKPAIQYVVEEALSSGILDIVIVTGRGNVRSKITSTRILSWMDICGNAKRIDLERHVTAPRTREDLVRSAERAHRGRTRDAVHGERSRKGAPRLLLKRA